MKKSVLKEIQNLIIKGQLERAISSLIEYCEKGDSGNYEESILLSTQFHIIERKERIGLGEFSQEINRIAQAVLRIVIDEEKKSLPIHEEKESSESIDSRLIAIETKVDKLTELLKAQWVDPIKLLENEYFWRHLEPGSKNYLYSAEKTLILEDLLDFSSVVIQYAKTLENEFINKVFLPYSNFIQDFGQDEINEYNGRIMKLMSNFNERMISFSDVVNYILWGIKEKSNMKISFMKFIEKRFSIINKEELAKDLEGIKDLRNRAAHVGVITKIEAEDFRNKVLSILKNILNRPYKIK
ncbi:MAG: hypothetical protein H6557_08565 [Lewinellaceae bacterium]|nr:hypothetical protein [Lewinellaceae bacterium]